MFELIKKYFASDTDVLTATDALTLCELDDLEELHLIDTKFDIYKVKKNDKCLFDEFVNKLKSNQKKHENKLRNLSSILLMIALDETITPNKFKKLRNRPNGDNILDYEIRLNRIRIYLYKDPSLGYVLCNCAPAKRDEEQPKQIAYMRSIKKSLSS